MRLSSRVERLEERAPLREHDRVSEVYYRIIEADGTPAVNPDGSPMVLIHRITPTEPRRGKFPVE